MDPRTLAQRVEAVRVAPDEASPWHELALAAQRAGAAGDLGRALPLVEHLIRHLEAAPRQGPLRLLLLRLLGLEVTGRDHRRLVWWNQQGRLGHDETGHFDLATGFPLFVRVEGSGLELNWIPPGRLRAGTGEVFSMPETLVEVSRGFYLGRYPVLRGEYQGAAGGPGGDPPRAPVEGVSWQQAAAYCAALTRQAREQGRCPATWAFQLPGELEWEYAGRVPDASGKAPRNRSSAGVRSPPGPPGATTPSRSITGRSRHPFGLEAMGTPVLEWCQDASGGPGRVLPETLGQDPWLGPGPGTRVVRGQARPGSGGFGSLIFRRHMAPDATQPGLGFRVCFQARQPATVQGDRPAPSPGATPPVGEGGVWGTLGRWLGFGG